MISIKKRLASIAVAAALLVGAAGAALAQGVGPAVYVNAQTGTSYTVAPTDCNKVVTLSNASAVAVTLPQAGASGNFLAGCPVNFVNLGAGIVTITPTTSTIGGNSSLLLVNNRSAAVISDGTNYQVQMGYGGQSICTASGATPQTCNGQRGTVTTNSLSTAAATDASYVINNSSVSSASLVVCSINAYSGTLSTNGDPVVTQCVPGSGTITVNVRNVHAANALSGTVAISFAVQN